MGEAGGAEGSVSDRGVGSSAAASAWALSLVCGSPGSADARGAGPEGDAGGVMGALGLCGEVTGRKSGLLGGDVAR